MIEQEIEDSLQEDFLEKNESTPREASSFAHNTVHDILDFYSLDSSDPELEALNDFPDLLESVEETIDFKDRVVQ